MRSYVILVLFASCALNTDADISVNYILSRQAAIHAWGEVYGSVNPICVRYAKLYEVHERDNVGRFCVHDTATGCTDTGTLMMWIKYRETPDGNPDVIAMLKTGVHEYIHVIGLCQRAQPDGGHNRKRSWSSPDSVLEIGQRNVIELYDRYLSDM